MSTTTNFSESTESSTTSSSQNNEATDSGYSQTETEQAVETVTAWVDNRETLYSNKVVIEQWIDNRETLGSKKTKVQIKIAKLEATLNTFGPYQGDNSLSGAEVDEIEQQIRELTELEEGLVELIANKAENVLGGVEESGNPWVDDRTTLFSNTVELVQWIDNRETLYSNKVQVEIKIAEFEAQLNEFGYQGDNSLSETEVEEIEQKLRELRELEEELVEQIQSISENILGGVESFGEAWIDDRETLSSVRSSLLPIFDTATVEYIRKILESEVESDATVSEFRRTAQIGSQLTRESVLQETVTLEEGKILLEREVARIEQKIKDIKENKAEGYDYWVDTYNRRNAILQQIMDGLNNNRTQMFAGADRCPASAIISPQAGHLPPSSKAVTVSGLGAGVDGFGRPGIGPTHTVHWDAPAGEGWIPGPLDDDIVDVVEPKYKHGYKGRFTGKLSVLDHIIKTMDRPKVDIESIEQLRNNVVRIYPIRYSYGDVSFTFWDDINHYAARAIINYFNPTIWSHGSTPGHGSWLARDGAVITSFEVTDYVMNHKTPMTYRFENALLSSYDLDSHDDESDGDVHTLQVVFKFEGFSIMMGGSPLTSGNPEPSIVLPPTPVFNLNTGVTNTGQSTFGVTANAGGRSFINNLSNGFGQLAGGSLGGPNSFGGERYNPAELIGL